MIKTPLDDDQQADGDKHQLHDLYRQKYSEEQRNRVHTRMRINENTIICGDRVILVPYKLVPSSYLPLNKSDEELIVQTRTCIRMLCRSYIFQGRDPG